MAEEKQQPEMEVDEEWEDDEVFYERIEAPKFVDFTTPDHYRPDDRYWFCLRVGCDQKHEEEMDHEKIYKDFVLRVMAARSPNVRLQKALSRRATGKNIKCPLTVPAKSSKSRLSKLAVVSNISHKLIEDKEKISHPSKPTSTPKIKGKLVAAKYLTTPRNKKCLPNPNSFRSVQNPKPAALAVPKSRTIAKALVFHSPKKAISLKKSVELRTPLTKLCQGIKKLEISDQKKRVLGCSEKSKDIKCYPGDSLRNRNSQKDESKTPKSTGKSQTRVLRKARPVHLTSIQNQAKLEKKCHSKKIAENECSKPGVDLTSRDSNEEHVTASENHEVNLTYELNYDADQRGLVGNDLPKSQPTSGEDHCGDNIESGTEGNLGTGLNKTDHSICFQTSEGVGHHGSECIDSDDKENVSVPDENRSLTNNISQAGENILGVQKMQKVIKKNAQPAAKNLKEGLLSTNVGASGMKSKKPKPTNPKPFRLRTDERGILREADLQRKKQGNVEYSDNENRCTEDNPEGNDRDSKDLRSDLSKDSGIKSHKSSDGKVRLRKSSITPERCHATQIKTANLRNAKSPMASCLRQDQKLTVIQEASADISKPKKVGKLHENGATAMSRAKASTPSRMLSRGRRPLTIPKEPDFHSTHRPKSCTKNLAEQVPL
ncbi:PREDICTED: uncharacterized protein LOC109213591 [Nicotiana attenuata]|nr:PREDICTED: uncharacterized protein LOC109213591 [Nicotiana attenuata]